MLTGFCLNPHLDATLVIHPLKSAMFVLNRFWTKEMIHYEPFTLLVSHRVDNSISLKMIDVLSFITK